MAPSRHRPKPNLTCPNARLGPRISCTKRASYPWASRLAMGPSGKMHETCILPDGFQAGHIIVLSVAKAPSLFPGNGANAVSRLMRTSNRIPWAEPQWIAATVAALSTNSSPGALVRLSRTCRTVGTENLVISDPFKRELSFPDF